MATVKVKATKDCYVNDRLQREGSKFEVDESLLSHQCMERVDGKPFKTAKELVVEAKAKPAAAK